MPLLPEQELKRPSSHNLVELIRLNTYHASKKNIYLLSYSRKFDYFTNTLLADEFNLILLYYDLHNSYKIENGASLMMSQFAELFENEHEGIVLGHSFDGYIASQLASILPAINYCVLIDTANTFEAEKYINKHVVRSLFQNLYRQIAIRRDFGYPFSLVRHVVRNLRKPKKEYDHSVRTGAEFFFKNVTFSPIINNCIFFKATRSCMGNKEHGLNWKPYVAGDFDLIDIVADHVTIKAQYDLIASHIVRIIKENN